MKKSIFILAALFAAVVANAQITLERTINDFVYPWTYAANGFSAKFVYGDLLWTATGDQTDTYITIYDAYSYDEITTFNFSGEFFFIAARGYFTNTNEVCVLLNQNNQLTLISESGDVLQNLGECPSFQGLIPEILTFSDGTCKLFVWSPQDNQGMGITRIYSLPGNGEATEISTPSSPKRSARKIARDGQVLVQTDTNIYTLQGAEVK